MITKSIYKITALTNLHVGSGDQNYGVVDKLVQRDAITGFPEIHGSSLKGALKIYCREVLNSIDNEEKKQQNDENKEKEETEIEKKIKYAFGMDDNQGNDKFFAAHLLTYPVRSDIQPFFRATCPTILKCMRELLLINRVENDKLINDINTLLSDCIDSKHEFIVYKNLVRPYIIEDYDLSETNILIKSEDNSEHHKAIETLGYSKDDFVIIRDDIFMEICSMLPVVARNRIEKDKNLWYEEFVPRQSDFYFIYLHKQIKDETGSIMDDIDKATTEKMPLQIGANGSVGYGYCTIKKFGS